MADQVNITAASEAVAKANESLNEKLKTVKASDIEQQALKKITETALLVQDLVNQMADMLKPIIVDLLDKLRKITAKLNNAVDINRSYDKVNAKAATLNSNLQNLSPEKLAEFLQMFNEQLMNALTEDSPIVQDTAEKLVGPMMKAGFLAILPPVKSLGALVPSLLPIADSVTAVVEALEGLEKIATVNISDDLLNKMASIKQAQDVSLAKIKGDLEASKDKIETEANKTVNGIKDMIGTAVDTVKDVSDNIVDSTVDIALSIGNGAMQAWKDFKCPELPPGIESTVRNFIKAVEHVCKNIANIEIVLLFKLIGCIFDCFNLIVEKIGVPTMPSPLDKIMKIIPDVIAINDFIMGLPISLLVMLKAIVKKKMKQLQIMSNIPIPVAPVKLEPDVEALGEKGCGGGASKEKYTVTFYIGDDKVNQQEVDKGSAASDILINGSYDKYINVVWIEDFSNVTASIDVHARDGWSIAEKNYSQDSQNATHDVNGVKMSLDQYSNYSKYT